MIEIFKDDEQKTGFVSTYQDPFKSDKIKKIEFTIENSFWTKHKTSYTSRITFDAGPTTGYHRMEADSFLEIIEQTQAFIRSLHER